ncbi:N-acetylmuramoyl-L-alanine amidase [Jeotgalibacillus malaysiensis]|uniref:N-acetylmuramoyl-L-alanine amidase n=1 Tax=Jeotgalibacillus malaysiensis TaxID=1508404 RepID=A0A0B5AWD2_9BACL|nr:N-acetylmuramoyl-L-alanine amidase [Jeotgalibacillus malaysiensis]AJD92888.1 N-acetylmuramoyl-L-alanine amidase [Jeotgalibacillus malaysiensis]
MSVGNYLNLMPHMSSWRVYVIGRSPVAGNEVGSLAPTMFGGLSYRITGNPSTDLYTIQTESFGTVNIYAPRDNDSSITTIAQFDNQSNSTGSGDYLNLQPHMTSWRVYPIGASPVAGNEVGSLAPATFGGLSYRILDEPSGDLYTIETESFGRVNIFAPRDPDSTISNSPEFSNGGDRGSSETGSGEFLNLAPHMDSWRVYPFGVSPVSGNEVGNLAPSRYGGLSYEILGQPSPNLYTILTESFGRVNIYAPEDNDSSFTSSPLYLDSADGSAGATHGNYLNLMPHMTSWRVYPLGVPMVAGNEAGNLGPSLFGGLSYRILGSTGTDSYTISTESFGTVNIYAPRDDDSSITSTPVFGEVSGGTESGGGSTIINDDPIVSNPNGVKIILDAGHGGHDDGATGNGLIEKNVNLTITRELGRILALNGANVQFRRSYDTYNKLDEIVDMANSSGADLFISIHCNAIFSATVSGTECFTDNPSPAESQLSAAIAESISSRMGIYNRGAKQESFRVIKDTRMPAILVETGFLTNSGDAYLLRTQPEAFASAIASAIISNLGLVPSEPILTEEEKRKLVREERERIIENFREAYFPFREHVTVKDALPVLETGGDGDYEAQFTYGPFKGKFILSKHLKTTGFSNAKAIVKNGKIEGEIGANINNKITENIGDFGIGLNAASDKGFAVLMKVGDIQHSIGFDENGNPKFSITLNMPDIVIVEGVEANLLIQIELVFDPDVPQFLEFITVPQKEAFKEAVNNPKFQAVAGTAGVLALIVGGIWLVLAVPSAPIWAPPVFLMLLLTDEIKKIIDET